MKNRVIIIGAGPGGLASAMLLAARGYQVTIVERLPHVGGRTSTFRQDDYAFDLGPTFFLYPRNLELIFDEAGYDLAKEVDLIRLDPQYRIVFGDGQKLDATGDVVRMQREMSRFSAADAGNLPRYLAENRKKLGVFEPVLTSSFDRLTDLLHPKVLKGLMYLRPWRSVHGEVSRFFKDPRIQLAFTFQSKYVGMSPFQCPSLFSILSFLEYEHGVFHPRGGCGALTQAMARIAREMGVDIRLNEPVDRIRFRGRQAVGVQTSQGSYDADAVVMNADFARAMSRLVPDELRRRWTDKRIEKKKYSCSTFMMYLGLEGRQDDLPHHVIRLTEDYMGNLEDIESRHRLTEDPSFYVQNASVSDPTLAPPGGSTLYVLVPVTHRHDKVDWKREAPRYRANVLRKLEHIGLKDVEKRIRTERIVTPADWDSQYQIHKGAVFSLSHNIGQMLYWRPHNRFEDLDSVYLVGGGTHPGSGLPVIFSSARITADAIEQDLRSTSGTRATRRLAMSIPRRPAVAPSFPVAAMDRVASR